MRILICDDDKTILHDMKDKITEYISDVEVTVCSDMDSLTRLCESDSFDLVFADIVLNGDSYIAEVSKLYHEFTQTHPFELRVVFITGYTQKYAQDTGMEFRPYGFISKPVESERVYRYIDRAKAEMVRQSGVLRTTFNKVETIVPFGEISYIELIGRKIHIKHGEQVTYTYEKLDELEKRLDSRFIRFRKSCIVNADYISKIDKKELTLKDGCSIAVPANYYEAVRAQYLRYKGRNML